MQLAPSTTTVRSVQLRRLLDDLASRSLRRPLRRAVRLRALPLALAVATGLCLIAGAPTGPLSGAYGSLSQARMPASPAASGSSLTAMPAHAAASPLRYHRGYSVQSGWYCYGWPDGVWRCTQHWYRAASGALVSLHPAWVPNGLTSSAGATASHPATAALIVTTTQATPAGISQWAYTGRAAYQQPGGNFQGYSWGWCTSGAAMLADDWVGGLGNAADWTRNAAARGMATGYTPRAGATVVFQPGVQGASGGGHVAHVVAVYGGGWFLVEEAAFWWNGGGYGRISFRYAHAGVGVSFVY